MLALGGQRAELFVRSPTVEPPAMSATQSGTHTQDTKREGREQREREGEDELKGHTRKRMRDSRESHINTKNTSLRKDTLRKRKPGYVPKDEHQTGGLTQLKCFQSYKKFEKC